MAQVRLRFGCDVDHPLTLLRLRRQHRPGIDFDIALTATPTSPTPESHDSDDDADNNDDGHYNRCLRADDDDDYDADWI